MIHQSIIAKTWREHILFSVMIELTYRCNLDCFYCYNDRGLSGTPLPTDAYLSLFRELQELQVLELILTGGEPLARPDFFVIGGAARELGFVVRVKSNGHALGGELARRLREEVDPFVVEISVHGACAETHDRQTRVPGSFARLLENLRQLLRLGLRVRLNATMTRWNEHELAAMFALADTFGVPLDMDSTVSPRDDGDRTPLGIAPSFEGRRRLFRFLKERRRATLPADRQDAEGVPVAADKHCGAGSSTVTIDPYGNVLPCVQWRRPVGNIRRQSIREIWYGSAGLDEVRQRSRAAKQAVDACGANGHLLGFCPALAEVLTGDSLTVYEAAREQMELLTGVEAESGRMGLE